MAPEPNPLANVGLLAVALLLPLLLSPRAQAGLIQGRVVNRTLSEPADNCVVTLLRHGQSDVEVGRDTTDLEGRFAFEIGPDEKGKPYFLWAAYSGVEYFHAEVARDQGPHEIAVYDTTRSETALRILSHHIVIDAQADSVTQLLIALNNGDRTYLTGEERGHGLEVPLPEGVTGVEEGPRRLHLHGDILVDPNPVKPGLRRLVFAFRMPDSGRLLQEVRYPTESIVVLIAPTDAQAYAPRLRASGDVTLGQRRFLRFSGEKLKPGDTIDVRLDRRSFFEWLSRQNPAWAFGGLALVLLFFYFRPRRGLESKAASPALPAGQEEIRRRRAAILEQIADLDDRREAGEVSEPDYEARRKTLMAEGTLLTESLDSDDEA